MSGLCLMPSSPHFAEVNELANMIAWAKNPHMMTIYDMDLPRPEQIALVGVLIEAMMDRFDFGGGGPAYDYLAGL